MTLNHDNRAVWLYGSVAGCRADANSDIDVLVVDDHLRPEIGRPLAPLGEHVSVSTYSWLELEAMSIQGSLFLLHLKTEGRPMFEGVDCVGRLQEILEALGPYQRSRKDLLSFSMTLQDVRRSIDDGGSVVWELSVLATLLRNASILGCYLLGEPSFGRTEPIRRISAWAGQTAAETQQLLSLSAFQLHAVGRGTRPETPSICETNQAIVRVERIIQQLGQVIDG